MHVSIYLLDLLLEELILLLHQRLLLENLLLQTRLASLASLGVLLLNFVA